MHVKLHKQHLFYNHRAAPHYYKFWRTSCPPCPLCRGVLELEGSSVLSGLHTPSQNTLTPEGAFECIGYARHGAEGARAQRAGCMGGGQGNTTRGRGGDHRTVHFARELCETLVVVARGVHEAHMKS